MHINQYLPNHYYHNADWTKTILMNIKLAVTKCLFSLLTTREYTENHITTNKTTQFIMVYLMLHRIVALLCF